MDPQTLVGQQFGNYVLVRLLGKGGMGAVYLAEHPAIGRRVAIKVLAPELSRTAKNVERFLVEAKTIASIRHPNLIDIYDFGTSTDGHLYFVMELLSGKDLSEVLRASGAMPAEEVLPYVEQICAALEVIHGRGVVHRDLKPSNIFVVDGEQLLLKLLDFGLAKPLDSPQGSELTATGAIVGTPLTMAPEQAASQAGLLSPRSDIYALGVIMFWMLAGHPPFAQEAPVLVLVRHIMQPAPLLSEVVPGVPKAISELVSQCLHKKPDGRPSSAGEVAQRFARAFDRMAVDIVGPAPPSGPSEELPPTAPAPSPGPFAEPPVPATATVAQQPGPPEPETSRFSEAELLDRLLAHPPDRVSRLPLLVAAGLAVAITALLVVLVT